MHFLSVALVRLMNVRLCAFAFMCACVHGSMCSACMCFSFSFLPLETCVYVCEIKNDRLVLVTATGEQRVLSSLKVL